MHRFASGKLVVYINKGVAVKNSVPTKKRQHWATRVPGQIGVGAQAQTNWPWDCPARCWDKSSGIGSEKNAWHITGNPAQPIAHQVQAKLGQFGLSGVKWGKLPCISP